MKFTSLNNIFQDAKQTFQRFSWTLISSFAGTLSVISWIHLERVKGMRLPEWIGDELGKLAMTATLGLTLFLAIQVFSEVKILEKRKRAWFNLLALAVLVTYFLTLLGKLKGEQFYRFYMINANLHLLVAIAPFLFERHLTNAFWQYNKSLFIRVGICAIYSSTIYFGSVIAIACLNSLFNLRIREDIYFQLWFVVMGVFNTWFFLGGIPSDIKGLEKQEDYPKGLKIFTQFILIPLVVVYYVILYLYMGKIVATWTLPVGWLSSFIIGASLLGILTQLLVYPLRKDVDFGWIRTYAKYFYRALFPLVVLMAVAIFRRISEYGITVERYFVLLFTVWLFYISIRFTFKPETNIRLIPTSMCLLAAMAAFGPLSAVSVSGKSQLGRLEFYLSKNGYLIDGVFSQQKRKSSFKDSAEISSIVEYLHNMHGLGILNRWAINHKDFQTMDQYSFCRDFLGIEFVEPYQRRLNPSASGQVYFYYTAQPVNVLPVEGFDYLFNLQGLYGNQTPDKRVMETTLGPVHVRLIDKDNVFELFYGEEHFFFDLKALLKDLKESNSVQGYNVDPNKMIFEQESSRIKVRLILNSLNGNYVNETARVDS
ncbi:MAG: DUF4153 domain-containing protein, partial [Candidatus Omnitrophica bacterium]|nr:DUF4153 domain-containing protein [Candidatus Omnitrophota bacterium]